MYDDEIKIITGVILGIIILCVGLVVGGKYLDKTRQDIPCTITYVNKEGFQQKTLKAYLVDVTSSGDSTTVIIYKSWMQWGIDEAIVGQNIKVNCK